MTTYYVDNAGNDANAGTSLGSAWLTSDKVSSFSSSPGFAPGDSIVYTPGQTHSGTLTIVNSGTSGSYISIGTGRGTVPTRVPGNNPAILEGGPDSVVNIFNAEYVWLDNLFVLDSSFDPSTGATTSTGAGFNFKSSQTTNKLRGVRVTACAVSGTRDAMLAWIVSDSCVGYDDLQIWELTVDGVQRYGLLILNYNFDTGVFGGSSNTKFTNLYVGSCDIHDCTGNVALSYQGASMSLQNSTGVLVEDTVCHDIGVTLAAPQPFLGVYGMGFENVTNGIFSRCESYNVYTNFGGFDGEGFDIEPFCTNCFCEYCYAHDNGGCGFLGGGQTWRFNVSANNNRTKTAVTGTAGSLGVNNWLIYGEFVHLGHDGADATYYGNTAVANNGGTPLLGADGSGSTVTHLYNNIFAAVNASFLAVNVWKLDAVGNLYYYPVTPGLAAVHTQSPSVLYAMLSDLHTAGYEKNAGINYGVVGDPLLLNPTSTPVALPANPVATITNFDIPNNSPAVSEGIDYSLLSINPGMVDFHNVPVLFRNAGAQQQALSVWHVSMAKVA